MTRKNNGRIEIPPIGITDYAIGDALTAFPALYELAAQQHLELWIQNPAVRKLWAGPDVSLVDKPPEGTIKYNVQTAAQFFLHSGLHMIDSWYWTLGLSVPSRPARIKIQQTVQTGVDVFISPYSASGRLAGERHKVWPFAKWNEIIDRLLEAGLSVAICGVFRAGADPRSHDERFWGDREITVLDSLPLEQIAGHLAASGCVLTVDNGIAHIAHFVEAKHVQIIPSHQKLSPSSWVENRNKNCLRLNKSFADGLGALTINEVLSAVGKVRNSEFMKGHDREIVQADENVEMEFKYSIVACARWETRYITEWLNYYRIIGFDHIFLYCNDDDPTELYEKVLPFTIGSDPFVTFRHYPEQGQQLKMYCHFLEHDRNRSEWISFFDIDEFLRLPERMTIRRFMNQMPEDADCILFNWIFFGPDGHKDEPGASILTEYTRRQRALHPFTKYVARSRVFSGPDLFDIRKGHGFWHCPINHVDQPVRAVNVLGEDMSSYYDGFPGKSAEFINQPDRQQALLSTAVIHHYAFRSEAAFAERVQRGLGGAFEGQAAWGKLAAGDRFESFLAGLHEVEDRSLTGFWASYMKRALATNVFGAGLPASLPVSRGKLATQSSVSPWSRFQDPERDAAGALSGAINGGAKFHTDIEENPWWQVDLGEVFGIREIRIFNRMDQPGLAERASRLAIEIGFDADHWTEVYRREADEPFGGVDGNPLVFAPTIPVPGRYVRVRLLRRDYLHLDQVEVYGARLPWTGGGAKG